MPNLTHYRNNCIGCGACADICPRLWQMSPEDGKATLKDADNNKEIYSRKINSEDFDENQEAADFCPARVIKLTK